MIANAEIGSVVRRYLEDHPGERARLALLLAELGNARPLWSRSTSPGHVTCSAAVISDAGRVLMIHHKALSRWLLPGGHLDEADSSLAVAAARELLEETGIPAVPVAGLPADIDVHTIPANPAKGEPQHWHADFCWVMRATAGEIRLQEEEVTGHGWRGPAELPAPLLAAKLARGWRK